MANRRGKGGSTEDFLFLGSKITAYGDRSHEIRRQLLLGRKAIRNLRQCVKKQTHHFADKGQYSQYSQCYRLSSSHIRLWEKWKSFFCVRLWHGLYSPWNSPAQNTGVGSCSLLQGIFPTQGLNSDLLYCKWILYQLSHQEAQEY